METQIAIKRVFVTINPTTLCNRGCVHCACDSGPKGEFLDPVLFSKWIEEIKRVKINLYATITGGGEPLLCSYLPEMVKKLLALRTLVNISLVSSGSLVEDKDEIDRWQQIIKLPRQEMMRYFISYSLYQKHFPQRIKATLPILLANKKIENIGIMLNAHTKNIFRTHQSLLESLNSIEVESNGKLFFFFGLVDDYLMQNADFISAILNGSSLKSKGSGMIVWLAANMTAIYKVMDLENNETRDIEVVLNETRFVGRAMRNLRIKKIPWGKCFFMKFLDLFSPDNSMEGPTIHIGADGYYYMNCGCSNHPDMRIGKMSELSFSDALEVSINFWYRGYKMVLSDREICSDFCTLCRKAFVKFMKVRKK